MNGMDGNLVGSYYEEGAKDKVNSGVWIKEDMNGNLAGSYFEEGAKDKASARVWKPQVIRGHTPRTSTHQQPQADTEEVTRKLTGILNRLVPEKFEEQVDMIKKIPIKTKESLSAMVDLIYERAVSEELNSQMYAQICHHLSLNAVKNVRFRNLIINKCQKEFENNKIGVYGDKQQKNRNSSQAAVIKLNRQTGQDDNEIKLKTHSIGNMRFIGELYKLRMLSASIMMRIIGTLLDRGDDLALECFCVLIKIIGKFLENHCSHEAKSKAQQSNFENDFKCIEELVKDEETPIRLKFMMMDVIDLRKNNWVPQRKNDPVPPQRKNRLVPQRKNNLVPQKKKKLVPQQENNLVPQQENNSVPQQENNSVPQQENNSVPQQENNSVPQQENNSVPQLENNSVPQLENNSVPQQENNSVPQKENIQPTMEAQSYPIGVKKPKIRHRKIQKVPVTNQCEGSKPEELLLIQFTDSDDSNTPVLMGSEKNSGPVLMSNEKIDAPVLMGSENNNTKMLMDNIESHGKLNGMAGNSMTLMGKTKGSAIPADPKELLISEGDYSAGSKQPPGNNTSTANQASLSGNGRWTGLLRGDPYINTQTALSLARDITLKYSTSWSIKEVEQLIIDHLAPTTIQYFVQASLDWVLDRGSGSRKLFGQLYQYLISVKLLTVEQLLNGSKATLALTEEYEADIPEVCDYMGEIFASCLLNDTVPLSKMMALAMCAGSKRREWLASVLNHAVIMMSPEKIVTLLNASGFNWSIFNPE